MSGSRGTANLAMKVRVCVGACVGPVRLGLVSVCIAHLPPLCSVRVVVGRTPCKSVCALQLLPLFHTR